MKKGGEGGGGGRGQDTKSGVTEIDVLLSDPVWWRTEVFRKVLEFGRHKTVYTDHIRRE